MKIQIGVFEFQTKRKAEDYIRTVLKRYSHNQVIPHPDHDFVMALLLQHPRRSIVVDCGVKEFFVQHLDVFGKERRFCVRRVDSSIRDFSWRSVLSPKGAKAQVMSVCRYLIQPQIAEFRMRAFADGVGALKCPITGEDIWPDLCDIDHEKPKTFERLVSGWLDSIGLDYGDIEVLHKKGYQENSRFSDGWLEENWREYHADNAVLRAVHPRANRSLLRRRKCAL